MGDLAHADALHVSSRDLVYFAEAVRTRYNGLCETYHRLQGVSLVIPQSLVLDYQHCVTLMRRHSKGDYRHNESEVKSLNTFAQWTLDTNSELRNQSPVTFRPIDG